MNAHALLTSFCKFSTVPGLGRSNDCFHLTKPLYTFAKGDSAWKNVDRSPEAEDDDDAVWRSGDGDEVDAASTLKGGCGMAMVGLND